MITKRNNYTDGRIVYEMRKQSMVWMEHKSKNITQKKKRYALSMEETMAAGVVLKPDSHNIVYCSASAQK